MAQRDGKGGWWLGPTLTKSESTLKSAAEVYLTGRGAHVMNMGAVDVRKVGDAGRFDREVVVEVTIRYKGGLPTLTKEMQDSTPKMKELDAGDTTKQKDVVIRPATQERY
jgi:hypothetical protein